MNNPDGYITIGTKVDNSGLEKGLKETEKISEKFEKENKPKYDTTYYQEELKKLQAELDETIKKQKELEDFYNKNSKNDPNRMGLSPVEGLSPEDSHKWYTFPEEEIKYENKIRELNADIERTKREIESYERMSNKELKQQVDTEKQLVEETEKRLDAEQQITAEKSKGQKLTGILSSVKDIGGTLLKGIVKIGKAITKVVLETAGLTLALGIIGSIIAVITKATTTALEENEQLIVNIKYLAFVISQMLVNASNGWVNSFVDGIQKIINAIATLIAYISYIVKAWFGIDLLANTGVDAFKKSQEATEGMAKNLGGASKSAKELKKQLAGFDEMNVLSDNTPSGGGGGAGGIGGAGATPNLLPNVEWPDEMPEWIKWIAEHKDEVIAGLIGIATAIGLIKLGVSGLLATGIGLVVAGLVYAIEGLLGYLKDPTWDNFGKVIIGIGIAIAGLGIIIGGLPLIIAGVIAVIWGLVVKNWEKIEAFLQKGINWLSGKSDWIRQTFGETAGYIYDKFVGALQSLLDWTSMIMNKIKANFDEIIKFVKNVFAGNWKGAWENVKNIFRNIWDSIKNTALTIGKDLATAVGNAIMNKFKSVVNSALYVIESVLNSPIAQVNRLISAINTLPGVNMSRLQTFKLPRLAKGGIINMPGKGVPIGGAIAGEVSREAVIPLTDSQQMQLLGEAIGKYITINANITNTMNGRVISKELQRINGESDFAYNR